MYNGSIAVVLSVEPRVQTGKNSLFWFLSGFHLSICCC